jgi:hypothetical protein
VPTSSSTLDALDSAGNGLRVTFFWRVDRYAHRIERIEGGVAVPLIDSIEGSDLDRWPSSPPLQQLSIENLPDGRTVALLVGMAGSSHWSLTAERDANDIALLFDVACRVKEEGAVLGSAYRSLVWNELAEGGVLLHRPGGIGRPVVMEPIFVDLNSPPPRLEADAGAMRLRVDGEIASSQTVRWKYRVTIAC